VLGITLSGWSYCAENIGNLVPRRGLEPCTIRSGVESRLKLNLLRSWYDTRARYPRCRVELNRTHGSKH
jgi:hypothetical protein